MKNKTVEVDRSGLRLLIVGGWGCAAVALMALVKLNQAITENNNLRKRALRPNFTDYSSLSLLKEDN